VPGAANHGETASWTARSDAPAARPATRTTSRTRVAHVVGGELGDVAGPAPLADGLALLLVPGSTMSRIASASVMPWACTRTSRTALIVERSCIFNCCIFNCCVAARHSGPGRRAVRHQLLGVHGPPLDERTGVSARRIRVAPVPDAWASCSTAGIARGP